jgi:acid-sensing ion channel, other
MQLIVPLQPHAKQAKVLNQWKNQKILKALEIKRENFILSTWKAFTKRTSVHGVQYLTEASITLIEKVLWALAIILATAAMIYSCLMLSDRFNSSLLSTVFESTNYKVSEIPFAAVSLCNNNRLNYSKTNDAIAKFLPNQSKNETETFVNFMRVLQNLEYGSFDEFDVIKGRDVSAMDKLNLTEVYEFMMHDCREFFVSCWWRNSAFNCCEWFSKQRTEYGICWSFNSFSNVGSKFVNVSSVMQFLPVI